MSIHAALGFFRQARHDETLQDQLRTQGHEVTLDALVTMARSAGFSFTAEELQQAHQYDWGMRWVRYHHGDVASARPLSTDAPTK